MSKIAKYTPLIFLLTSVFADYVSNYQFEHGDCQVRFYPTGDDTLDKVAIDTLKSKFYKPIPLINKKSMLSGELYFTYKITRGEEKMYKSCEIESSIKMAKSRLPGKKDHIFFKKKIKRTLPRVTFKGQERCKKAIKETFIHIPTCKVSAP